MTREQLAKDAERLLKEETLNHALDAMRADSLEDLAEAPADDATEILRWQAQVKAIDEFRERLEAYINDAQPEPERTSFA